MTSTAAGGVRELRYEPEEQGRGWSKAMTERLRAVGVVTVRVEPPASS